MPTELEKFESWHSFKGLSGQPWTIALHGNPNQLVLRIKYMSAHQLAQVSNDIFSSCDLYQLIQKEQADQYFIKHDNLVNDASLSGTSGSVAM